MTSHATLLLLQLGGGLALRVGAPAQSGPGAVARAGFFDTFADNMKQMTDQRVAKVSHVMLRTDPAALNLRTKGEAYELLSAWKEVIGDDQKSEEKFAICAREVRLVRPPLHTTLVPFPLTSNRALAALRVREQGQGR